MKATNSLAIRLASRLTTLKQPPSIGRHNSLVGRNYHLLSKLPNNLAFRTTKQDPSSASCKYSTNVSKPKSIPVPLAFEKYQPHAQIQDSITLPSPIIILHGLFGSKQNWRSLAKKLSQLSNKTVFTLDLRNHGESASTPGFTSYLDYAIDVKNFINLHNLNQVILMGHSMGGKVAMTLALENCNSKPSINLNEDLNQPQARQEEDDRLELIKKLIVIDISPGKGRISENFLVYLDGFKEINSNLISSRKEADEILSRFEKDASVRQFLLTNLKKVEENEQTTKDGRNEESRESVYKIRLPIQVLQDQISNNEIGDFPYDDDPSNPIVPFSNPSLFIKGARSKYINKYNLLTIHNFFQNFKLITLDTGHWVHAEKPNDFLKSVVDFIKQDELN